MAPPSVNHEFDLVARRVEHHDPVGAAVQRFDQPEVVVVAAVGHVHPGAAVAELPGRLGPQQAQRGLQHPVPQRPGPPAAEPEVQHVGPDPCLPPAVPARPAVPQRVRRQVPQQQGQRPVRPPPVIILVLALVRLREPRQLPEPLTRRALRGLLVFLQLIEPVKQRAGVANAHRVRHPHAEADVGEGEQDAVRMPCRRSHQRRDRRPADRGDVEQGRAALAHESFVIRRPGLRALRGLLRQATFPAQGHVVRVERDAEPVLSRRHLASGVDVSGAADYQSRFRPPVGLSCSSERQVAAASSNSMRARTGSSSCAARRVTAKASASRQR